MSGSDEAARLERVYDVSATASWIRAGGFPPRRPFRSPTTSSTTRLTSRRRWSGGCVAPDAATTSGDAVPTRVFVLADTTFGSCCVDEVAAAHHAADAIVHFGRACMSPVARLPARFVFNKVDLDVSACAGAIGGARRDARPTQRGRIQRRVHGRRGGRARGPGARARRRRAPPMRQRDLRFLVVNRGGPAVTVAETPSRGGPPEGARARRQ